MQKDEKVEVKNENDEQMSSKDIITNNDKIATQSKVDKSFVECLINNFKELHPVATLCHTSLISPLILHSLIFVFNTLILFGFNAVLYCESLIEKRIYDNKRNYFISCQVLFTFIIKLVIFVSSSQRANQKIV